VGTLSFGKYTPGEVPEGEKDIARVVKEELRKVAQAMQLPVWSTIILEELHAQPAKVYDGMLARADGTNWNPGSGKGLYYYVVGTGWVFIA
jgi:hypothetical protein